MTQQLSTTETLISDAQRSQFLENGFIRLDNVADETDLAWYRAQYARLFSGEVAGSNHKNLGGSDAAGRNVLPQILGASKTMPELLERNYFHRITEIAKFILGPEAAFRADHMILKPAGYGATTPWHQDQAYHDSAYRYTNINFWMPLDAVTVEGGCMQYVRQTHKGTLLPHEFLIPGDNQSAMVAQDQDFWSANATALPCPGGSVCLHHSYCMHYAGPNRTENPRRAYIIVFGLPPVPVESPFVLPWQDDPSRRLN
ncbi:MAG: phytanoyl-CoA dioxygenase family protein [Opitutales bacterium]